MAGAGNGSYTEWSNKSPTANPRVGRYNISLSVREPFEHFFEGENMLRSFAIKWTSLNALSRLGSLEC